MRRFSWKKAYACSAAIHVLFLGIVAFCVAGQVMHQEKQQMYVVDLDDGDMSQGSGHAGGGGGSNQLFPDKLSTREVAQKVENAQLRSTTTVPEATPATAAPQAAPATGSSTGHASAVGTATGSGTGTGGGVGSGSGTGSGAGHGDGHGYGKGSGNGQGSGNGNAPGTGSSPFDKAGFRARIDSHKQYPPMAVKRHLQGNVTIQTTLDGNGNCLGVAVVGSSGQPMLDSAAVRAARAACPFHNATKKTITVTTTVRFELSDDDE